MTRPTWTYAEVERYLLAMTKPEGERKTHETWVRGNVPRFLRTLELVPEGGPGQTCVEIGSMPYTFTLLMKKYRPYEMFSVDFVEAGGREHRETVSLPAFDERHEFVSHLHDIEREAIPQPDSWADGVLFCEVLEHLTTSPTHVLAEAHRLLKPGGWLVLTTPNVANLVNFLNLLHGRNVYRPYELVFGPTWRHNREYTVAEVRDLLEGCGFVVEELFAEDAYPRDYRPPVSQRLLERVLRRVYRQSYGFQLYARARRGPTFRWYMPEWLYEHVDVYTTPRLEYVRVGENDAIQLGQGWEPVQTPQDGTKLVRWMAAAHAMACVKRPPHRSCLTLEVYRGAGPADVDLWVAAYPNGEPAEPPRRVQIPDAGWHRIELRVPEALRADTVRIEIRAARAAAERPALAIASIAWEEPAETS